MNVDPDAAATGSHDLALAGGRYALEQRLAVGGMGEIWQGRDTLLERQVAVKLPRTDLAADRDFLDPFVTEARHAAALQHPNVATVFDFGADDQHAPYIVMELIDGDSLSARLRESRQLDASAVRDLLSQVASALAAAHEAGVCHRDVKPGNLLFRSNGSVAVTDFGIARAAGAATVTRASELRGTAQYVSPEQVRGGPASPASDMYALGVVAYECLVGSRPFDGSPMEVLAAKRDALPPALPPSVPAELAELVTKLLNPDPSVRPTAAQVVAALPGTPGPAAPIAAAADAADGDTTVLPLPVPLGPTGHVTSPIATEQPTDAHPSRATTRPTALRRGGDGWTRHLPRRPGVLLAGALALVLLFITGIALGHRGGSGSVSATTGPSAAAAKRATPRPVAVAAAQLFHPGGSDSDHAGDVRLSFDGNLSTAWRTQHYASATFGNLRPGVGIIYDLGRPVSVAQVRLTLTTAGATVQVHAGPNPAGLLSSAVLASREDCPAAFDARLSQPLTAQFWLVWFSRLPAGASHQAGVAEARFLS
jgi:serine/threonine-protein kinase